MRNEIQIHDTAFLRNKADADKKGDCRNINSRLFRAEGKEMVDIRVCLGKGVYPFAPRFY